MLGMKKIGFVNLAVGIISYFFFADLTGFAQLPGGSPTGLNAALTKLFGSDAAFIANADVQVLDKSQQEWVRTPMTFTVLDGKVRADIDMMQTRSRDLPPKALDSFKQMGMERVSSIFRPDKRAMYIVYPGAKSYANVPLSSENTETSGKNLKAEKTSIGKESTDGHPCIKNRVLVKDNKGATVLDATTWNATDLKDFPIRIVTNENGNTTIMRFLHVKFVKPDAKQFDPPAGYTQYQSPAALVWSLSKKFLAGSTNK